jgi:hypothetical protein
VAHSNFSATNLKLIDVAADPVDAFFGSKAHGLPWTYGTMENLTVQTFDYEGSTSWTNPLLTAEVFGFGVDMQCEQAIIGAASPTEAGVNRHTLLSCPNLIANVSGAGCQLTNVTIAQTAIFGSGRYTNITSNYQGTFNYYVCNSGLSSTLDVAFPNPPNATSPDDYRFLLTMSELSWSIDSHKPQPPAFFSNWTIPRVIGVLCKPSYSVDKYKVTLQPSLGMLQSADIIPHTSTSLAGLSLKTLLDGITNALANTTYGKGGDDFLYVSVPPMFEVLAGLINDSRQDALLDPDLLRDLSRQTLQGIGTQFAQRYLKQDQEQSLSGSIQTLQQRLQVKRLTVGLLLTALGLLAVAVLVLIRIRPWNSAPCRTESLASAATILTASNVLRKRFQAHTLDTNHADTALHDSDYETVVDHHGSFTIQPYCPPRNAKTLC